MMVVRMARVVDKAGPQRGRLRTIQDTHACSPAGSDGATESSLLHAQSREKHHAGATSQPLAATRGHRRLSPGHAYCKPSDRPNHLRTDTRGTFGQGTYVQGSRRQRSRQSSNTLQYSCGTPRGHRRSSSGYSSSGSATGPRAQPDFIVTEPSQTLRAVMEPGG